MTVSTTAPWDTKRKVRHLKEKSQKGLKDYNLVKFSDVPKAKYKKERKKGTNDLAFWLRFFHPERFSLPFAEHHLEAIQDIEYRVRYGGKKAIAFPRGDGKTSILISSAEWAVLNGWRQYVLLLGINDTKANELHDDIQTDLFTNQKIVAAYPEVCFYVQHIEGKAIRALNQTTGTCEEDSVRTHIEWKSKKTVLPLVRIPKDEKKRIGVPARRDGTILSSQGVIQCAGFTSGDVRGAHYVMPETGEVRRPDQVLIDDPQDDEIAGSPEGCNKREKITEGTILGVGGPTKDISAFMACTVIKEDDYSYRYTDPSKKPAWDGMRIKMMPSMPKSLDLWDEYKQLRDAGLQSNDLTEANQFYIDHKESMDEGASVSWPERVKETDISAIQTAMNIYLESPVAFASEYQNDPLSDIPITEYLTVDEIQEKQSITKRQVVPQDCHTLVAFIDVHKAAHYYTVVASADNYVSTVIEYGTAPPQKTIYYSLRSLRHTLQSRFRGISVEAQVRKGLDGLIGYLFGHEYIREDGSRIELSRVLVDTRWGEMSAEVRKCLEENPHTDRLMPAFGEGITATKRDMFQRRLARGERRGLHFMIPLPTKGYRKRHIIYDTNFWKTFVHERFSTPKGQWGCLTLYQTEAWQHRMIAEHMHAEYPQDVEEKHSGRTVRQWQHRGIQHDNHYLDCLTGCMVALSLQGIKLETSSEPKPKDSGRFKTLKELKQGGYKTLKEMKL